MSKLEAVRCLEIRIENLEEEIEELRKEIENLEEEIEQMNLIKPKEK